MLGASDVLYNPAVPRSVLSLVLLSLFTFFLGLGRQAITDSDEGFYAEASREMVESGDWLTPRFNYEDRWQKPVLYYWLTAGTYAVAGPSEWAARVWSALSGLGLVLITWAAARKVTGHEHSAWIAGAIVATCVGYCTMARAALPDLPLALLTTAGIWTTLRASETTTRPELRWWGLAGLSGGLGFLMKGPVAVVIPAIVLLPIWWRERRVRTIRWRGVIVAMLVGALVGVPWYLAMTLEHGGAYIQSFMIGDNVERFATARFNDPRPFWFYVPVLLGGMLPWSVYLATFAGSAIVDLLRSKRRFTDVDWRLTLWAGMPLLFYTLSIGKQPRYILPVLPPLAILLATSLVRRIGAAETSRLSQPALSGATWVTAALFAVLAIVLARVQPLFITAYPAATWSGVVAMGLCSLALAWVAARHAWTSLPTTVAVAGAVLVLALEFGAEAGERPEAVEQMAAQVSLHRASGAPVGVYGVFVRNLVFYTGVRQADLVDQQSAVAFVRSTGRVLLVTSAKDLPLLETASGVTLRTLAKVEYLNTANVRLRTFLRADPAAELDIVVLVTNR